ncbi:MAG: hypothetical protein AB203_00775 [Parcubacteria bacterium C7867-008]|nr:MAG: hypothetical protein AB203_00775 [Parcubacteria bacterium C7867-008]
MELSGEITDCLRLENDPVALAGCEHFIPASHFYRGFPVSGEPEIADVRAEASELFEQCDPEINVPPILAGIWTVRRPFPMKELHPAFGLKFAHVWELLRYHARHPAALLMNGWANGFVMQPKEGETAMVQGRWYNPDRPSQMYAPKEGWIIGAVPFKKDVLVQRGTRLVMRYPDEG